MKYKIIVTDSAFRDLENIKEFIASDNPKIASKYIERIFDKLETLETLPNSGLKIYNKDFSYANARYLICANHIAFYQINEIAKCIYILRVLSHFQKWKNIINKDLLKTHEIIIENDIISLEKINQSMIYDFYKNSRCESNKKYQPEDVFESLEEAGDIVSSISRSYSSSSDSYTFAIIRKVDNVNIGFVQLMKIDECWEIGYHVADIFANKGYATMSLRLFLDFIKSNLKINEVLAITLSTNKASRKVLEKCGFENYFEGLEDYQGSKRKVIKAIKRFK